MRTAAPRMWPVQTAERLIGICQVERFDRRSDRNPWSKCQEFFRIAAGQVGNGADDAFAPQEPVRE